MTSSGRATSPREVENFFASDGVLEVVIGGNYFLNKQFVTGVSHWSKMLAYIFLDNLIRYVVLRIFTQIFPNSRYRIILDAQFELLQCLCTKFNNFKVTIGDEEAG